MQAEPNSIIEVEDDEYADDPMEATYDQTIMSLPEYTWLPPESAWDVPPDEGVLDHNFREAETIPELNRMQHLPTPFALDEQYPKLRYGDVRCIGTHPTPTTHRQ